MWRRAPRSRRRGDDATRLGGRELEPTFDSARARRRFDDDHDYDYIKYIIDD